MHLSNALGVRPMGVSGMMYIQCTQCGTINKLKLGKTHRPPDSKRTGVGIFNVNTKLAAGMIHSGIGETQLNNLLSTINLHCIDHKSLKRRENEIGHVIEKNAKTSENNFLIEEAIGSLVIGEPSAAEDADLEENMLDNGISVSTDTCWQKKGSGRSYNSLSGVATLIGKNTKKILHHAQRVSSCRICQSAKKKGDFARVHECKQNWSGSAKAMEEDMVAQMVKDLVVVEKINVSEIAGDDDSTGFEKIKKQMPHLEIEKTSDRNHIKKNVNSKLYELKNSKMHKEFTQKVLDSIQKNFSYMIDQNQGSEDGIKNGLTAITEHMFGNHTFCNVSWCGGLTKGDAYKHLNLPYGKDLTSKQLKADLEKIFQKKLLTKANQLSKLSSSQANESFNNTVASKAPKRLHYSGSASLGYRV
ncbi:unnamed protein product [Mytilus edulis]|uniref:Mutator-like transposase domain-containing protein n=1 Tax=Mytilus edulis TaxID=6550 RepID=A0A8S3UCG9_MYTED|nr:unnamed protein product [Mytilus edulis]